MPQTSATFFTKGRTEKLQASIAHGDCPLCHQTLPSGDFMHTADFGVLVRNFYIARLTMSEAATFKIFQSSKQPFSTMAIADRMHTSREVAYIFIHNLRRKLAPLGIKICSVGQTYQVQFCK